MLIIVEFGLRECFIIMAVNRKVSQEGLQLSNHLARFTEKNLGVPRVVQDLCVNEQSGRPGRAGERGRERS